MAIPRQTSTARRAPSSGARPAAAKAAPPGGDSALFIGSIAKCFQVLEALNVAGRAVALTELAQLAELDRSATQRITHTLKTLGYLRQDAASRAFTLSGRMLEFGHTVLATDRLRACAQPHLEALNRRVSETVNLMKREDLEIVYVLRYPSLHAVSVDLHVGSRLPVFCSAAGRAILATMDEPQALALLKGSRRTAMTPTTITDIPTLVDKLREARALGYALNDQEAFIGDISVAAPLLDPAGVPLGAVNIAVPYPRWHVSDVLAKLVPPLLRTAAAIQRELRSY